MSAQLGLIALGGALGASSRFLMYELAALVFGRGFPYGTLAVNVLGSFAIGILFVVISERELLNPAWRSLLIVGFLGAFTTYSSFSLETMHLLEDGAVHKALLNIAANVFLCAGTCALGLLLARRLF